MADVPTLIDRLERLESGEPLPGDDIPLPGLGTVGRVRENTASLRCGSLARYSQVSPVPSRLACELVDNLDTIMAALRFWHLRHVPETSHVE